MPVHLQKGAASLLSVYENYTCAGTETGITCWGENIKKDRFIKNDFEGLSDSIVSQLDDTMNDNDK